MSHDPDALEALIEQRRSSLLMDPHRPVEADIVERLCRLATWAPNHKRTWPWRFCALSATARAELGEALALDWADQDTPEPSKLDKVRTKYQRAPVVVVAASTAGDSAQRTMENRDAVAAGLQNLLLGAAAVGLASLWSSPPVRRSPRTEALCGFPTGVELVAVVYLGWPAGSVETPERPPVALTWRS